jgi:hypothetical protein
VYTEEDTISTLFQSSDGGTLCGREKHLGGWRGHRASRRN